MCRCHKDCDDRSTAAMQLVVRTTKARRRSAANTGHAATKTVHIHQPALRSIIVIMKPSPPSKRNESHFSCSMDDASCAVPFCVAPEHASTARPRAATMAIRGAPLTCRQQQGYRQRLSETTPKGVGERKDVRDARPRSHTRDSTQLERKSQLSYKTKPRASQTKEPGRASLSSPSANATARFSPSPVLAPFSSRVDPIS